MFILKFFSIISVHSIRTIKKIFRHTQLSIANSTCRLGINAEINNCEFGKYVVIFNDVKIANSKVGDYSYIQSGSKIFNTNLGKFCSIASSVSIGPGIHDVNLVTTHPSLFSKSTPLPKIFSKSDYIISNKKVTIGNDVWIGEKAVVLDGVSLGNGSIVAAGAVVVKDVAAYSIVGGVPAKHIRYRFDEKTIKIFLESEWWNFHEEWFEKNSELMLDVEKFKDYLKC